MSRAFHIFRSWMKFNFDRHTSHQYFANQIQLSFNCKFFAPLPKFTFYIMKCLTFGNLDLDLPAQLAKPFLYLLEKPASLGRNLLPFGTFVYGTKKHFSKYQGKSTVWVWFHLCRIGGIATKVETGRSLANFAESNFSPCPGQQPSPRDRNSCREFYSKSGCPAGNLQKPRIRLPSKPSNSVGPLETKIAPSEK